VAAVRLLVADHHPLVLAGIRGALDAVGDIEIVGEATSPSQLIPLISRTSPDVVLLDLEMPDHDAMNALRQIRSEHPGLTVLVLSETDDAAQIMRALQLGASGYILKSIDPGDLAAAIRQGVNRTFFSLGGIELHVKVAATEEALSVREVEVLQLLAVGLSNREIAKDLWLSDQTIKFHLRNIYRKLGVSNRTEAARYAFDTGLADAATSA
jgi:DNA-binding NarL/FixJ family response regulator